MWFETSHQMNRRKFLRLSNTIVLGATGAALFPLPALPSRKIEYMEDISDNYRAWREAQIEVVKQGYKIRRACLERPVGGFRRATVHVTDGIGTTKTLVWWQPWRGDRIDE